jgi:acyl carrier protein
MTKGQRKQARDDWHLRWNQALKHTGLDRIYKTNLRFDMTTNKANKETRFTAIGFAHIQNIPQTFTIVGYATGEQKNGRACFDIYDLSYSLGSDVEMQIDTDAEDMPPLAGDLTEIGPAILNRIFESLHAQLPAVERSKAEAEQDRRACDETLKKLVQAAVKKCHAKGIAFQFIEAYRFFSDTRVEQPYYAKAVFKINEQHSDIRFKFKRIGTEQEFVLESVTVDGRDREINFRVSPFTVQNAIVVGMRNAIKWIKEGFKMDSTAIEKDPVAEQVGAKKTPAAKKPAVKKTAKVIENGELKDAPKGAVKVVKKKPAVKRAARPTKAELAAKPIPKIKTSPDDFKNLANGIMGKPPVEELNEDQQQIVRVFADQLGEPVSKFTMATELTATGADELDLVEIVMQIEEEFEFDMPDNIEHECKTIGDLYTHVAEKKAELAAAAAAQPKTKARRASKAKVEAETGKQPRMTTPKPKAKGKPKAAGSANFDAVNDGKLANRSNNQTAKPLPAPKTKADSLKWDSLDEAELVRMRKQLVTTATRIKLLERAKENGVTASVQVTADVKAKMKDELLIAEIKQLANLYGFTFYKAKKVEDFADKFTLKRTYMDGTKVAIVIHYDDSSQHRFVMETDKLPKGAKNSLHTLPVELKTKAQMLAVLRKLGATNNRK